MENAPLEDDNAFWPRVLMQLSQRMDEVQKLKAEVIHLRREVVVLVSGTIESRLMVF